MELSFENIHYAYSDRGAEALSDLSLVLHSAERVALIGRNGCGKSTLMLHANGILRPRSGRVLLNGKTLDYSRRALTELRRQVGLVFQNPEDQLFSANVFQDISLGPLNLGLSQAEARRRVEEVAALCDLEKLLERPTHALSGGEKTRAALAGVLAMEPQFLFADELTNSLDPWMRRQVLDILNAWVERGRTVVLSTHDWALARTWAQRIVWLECGRVYRQGPAQQVLTDQDLT
ncbi:MAG: energy-coupling factor ABC transporter ATP-binding protein [Anaerolineae bacterium]|nr:energy-coupling factor ABC transporter ATP-binding protein [Anaerolineae bacterium]